MTRQSETFRNLQKSKSYHQDIIIDGVVRAAVIKTCSDRFQLLCRSVKYLIPLDVRSSLPAVKESNPALKTKGKILSPPGQTRRDKAIARQLRNRELSALL